MKKLSLRFLLSGLGGLVVGLVVASWFDVQNDEAYFAVVSIFALVGAAIGQWVFPSTK